MRWRRKLCSIGCLNDESSDDNAEHAEDQGGVGECPERACALLERALEDTTEASNLAIAGNFGERRSMLELSVPGVAADHSTALTPGVAVEPLPNPDVAGPAEPPQVPNVTEILKRNHVTHTEAKLVKQVLNILEAMGHQPRPWNTVF
jgi:hypothetical protein